MILASTSKIDYPLFTILKGNTKKIQASIKKHSRKAHRLESHYLKLNNIKDLQFEFSFDDLH